MTEVLVKVVSVEGMMIDYRGGNMKKNDNKLGWLLLLSTVCVLPIGPVHADQISESLDQRFANHEIKVNDRLDHFREQLGITPAQKSSWDAYQNAIRRNMEDIHQQTTRESQHPTVTALEHFQRLSALKQEQLTDFSRVADAFSTLYATLDPAQKRIADEHFNQLRKQMLKRARGE